MGILPAWNTTFPHAKGLIMNVLLTGGAGYIGSHIVRALVHAGHTPVVYDSLVKGHAEAIDGVELVVADVTDGEALRNALTAYKIEAVIHLAAFIEAGESVEKPGKYFSNNTMAGLTLLEAMRDCGVEKLVFSSTAAVYGTPERCPIEEGDRLDPINPYGASKLAVEFMLRGYAEAHNMGFVALRYFNVAGADPAGGIGEAHSPETHLIPLILQVPLGEREKVYIFGNDYDTPDGTCIRDYVHVCDLVDAHVLGLRWLLEDRGSRVFNLGTGSGYSVREVVEKSRAVTRRAVPIMEGARRVGDCTRLVSASNRAREELGWMPVRSTLEQMITDAWRWHQTGHYKK